MKKFIFYCLTASLFLLASCEKEVATTKTTKEKLVGRWNYVSRVSNHFYNDSSHITTYTYQAGDYIQFYNNGTVTSLENGISNSNTYGVIDATTIWIGNWIDWTTIKSLTGTDMQFYIKTNNGFGTTINYTETTTNLKK
ncbi:MAG: hypothetical protein ABIO79_10340 [Ferruginibacter sp.]